MSESNGVTRWLSRVSLTIGIAAAVIYPTVTASIQWGEMQHELRANTAAVKDVAAGLEKVAADNASAISSLREQVAFAAETNNRLANENHDLREAVQQNGKAVQHAATALRAAVTDNTRATDWHSYRIRQLTEESEKKK